MISEKLKSEFQDALEGKFSVKIQITGATSLPGGCINRCYKLKTNAGFFFVKLNSASRFPGMFESEAKGLKLLKSTGTIQIPEVIFCGNDGETGFLILQFIEPGLRQKVFFRLFGEQMAQLHKHFSDFSGLEYDNYIGSLKQSNLRHKSWTEFFREERLDKQVELARNKGAIDKDTVKQFHHLFEHLDGIFPEEKSSFLHGDLWNGNYLTAANGNACLIDPAVYYGFREMDIAMSRLFGGFSNEFYESYQFHFPMEKGWEERADICNLYPLMVHVNLFGGGYLQEVKSILKRYN